MAFIRRFDIEKINRLTGESAALFELLKTDVYAGEVFPAVRKDELHFYYKGGCLYKFNGSFIRDKAYEKYSENTEGLCAYEKAKKQNENKFTNAGGCSLERQLLDRLNAHTFRLDSKTSTVVLDIEVRLNGEIGESKKCDIVLLNTEQRNLPKIMFVEGKVFGDGRVNVKANSIPKVIEQVNTYTKAIAEQDVEIVFEYINHIQIVNTLFGTEYESPFPSSLYNSRLFGFDLFVKNHLIPTAKLLVYETPTMPTTNGQHSIDTINVSLGADNVMWVPAGEEPTLDEIWSTLCK